MSRFSVANIGLNSGWPALRQEWKLNDGIYIMHHFALARDESARNVTVSDPLVEYPFVLLANALI
jgi:hypothetical protein